MSCELTESVQRRRAASSGFTLLELIIVLVVLVALAALVIPTLGFVRNQANHATAAAGATEVLNNLELFYASTGTYPNRMDSLLNNSGTLYSNVYSSASSYGNAVDPSGMDYTYYYLESGAGITEVMQHTEPDGDGNPLPNDSTTQNIPVSTSTASLFVIDPTLASSYSADKIQRIVRAAYPNQTTGTNVAIPDKHTLVAFGVGPRSGCVGTTMTSAPIHSGAPQGQYGRYIAVFDVSPGKTKRPGKVRLKMVLDSNFEVLATNVSDYKNSGPTDDQGNYIAPDPED